LKYKWDKKFKLMKIAQKREKWSNMAESRSVEAKRI
jgi:hypothetical protein